MKKIIITRKNRPKIIFKQHNRKIIHHKIFIAKCLIHKYDRETFIVYSGAMSHMFTTELNVSNLCGVETIVTV